MGGLAIVRRKGMFGITWGGSGAETWDAANAWDRGLTFESPDKLTKPYTQSSTIANALSTFVGDAASVGWELYAKGADDDPIESHPVLDLLDRPSPMFSSYQLWTGTYLSRKLFGAAAWYYPDVTLGSRGGLKATQGVTGQILMLDPRRLVRKGEDWYLRVFDGETKLDSDRLTIFMRPDPYAPGRWVSEIDAVLIEIEGDHAASQYNRSFFRDQFGLPSGLLVPHAEEANGPKERDAFVKRFNEDSARKRRSIGSVPPGWKWQDIGVSMKDMDFRNLREYARELMLAAIGVPPFMAGVLDKANYANAREQREGYWLGPQTRFLTEIQAVLNSDFLPKLGITDVELYPCWEKVKALLENLSEKVDVATKLFALGFTKRQINERLELGMEVDELEDADVGYLPFSVTPVSQLLNPPEPIAPDGALPPDPQEQPKSLRGAGADEATRSRAWRTIVNRSRDIEMRFNQIIRKHFHSIEEEVLSNVNGIRGWRSIQTKAVDDLMFDKRQAQASLVIQTAPLQRVAVSRGAESVIDELNAEAGFNMVDPRVTAKLTELSYKITRIDTTVETALRESLSEGLTQGESVGELAKRVREVMRTSKARSMTIARTETGFAFNTGRNEAMVQNGVKYHEWLSARDEHVRDAHIDKRLDGTTVPLGTAFSNGLMYPLDPSGAPGEVINCRCVAVPVIGD